MSLLDLFVTRGDAANEPKGSAEIEIDAPADKVYWLMSDVIKMGQWSPECYRCEWLGSGVVAEVGARFKGYNRHGKHKWSTTCTVTESDPWKLFSSSTQPKGAKTQSLWGHQSPGVLPGLMVDETINAGQIRRTRVPADPVARRPPAKPRTV